jgi:hypothetical protein
VKVLLSFQFREHHSGCYDCESNKIPHWFPLDSGRKAILE